jgi:FKBP-type peptidyl-prolyl cis-trans isomerase FkpA
MLPRGVQSVWTVVSLVVVSALVAGCNSPTSPTSSPSFTQTDLRQGTGTEAATGSVVTVEYTGWFYDTSQPDQKGVQFDTSTGRGPFSFTVGAGQVIAGWEQGIVGMRVGGVRRLIVPPSLAYGSRRVGLIPPNATLLFDVELLAVE